MDDSQIPEYKFEVVFGFSLDRLFQPPSKQKDILNPTILNLTAEEFEAKMSTSNGSNRTNSHNNDSLSGLPEIIEPDESQGVFHF